MLQVGTSTMRLLTPAWYPSLVVTSEPALALGSNMCSTAPPETRVLGTCPTLTATPDPSLCFTSADLSARKADSSHLENVYEVGRVARVRQGVQVAPVLLDVELPQPPALVEV